MHLVCGHPSHGGRQPGIDPWLEQTFDLEYLPTRGDLPFPDLTRACPTRAFYIYANTVRENFVHHVVDHAFKPLFRYFSWLVNDALPARAHPPRPRQQQQQQPPPQQQQQQQHHVPRGPQHPDTHRPRLPRHPHPPGSPQLLVERAQAAASKDEWGHWMEEALAAARQQEFQAREDLAQATTEDDRRRLRNRLKRRTRRVHRLRWQLKRAAAPLPTPAPAHAPPHGARAFVLLGKNELKLLKRDLTYFALRRIPTWGEFFWPHNIPEPVRERLSAAADAARSCVPDVDVPFTEKVVLELPHLLLGLLQHLQQQRDNVPALQKKIKPATLLPVHGHTLAFLPLDPSALRELVMAVPLHDRPVGLPFAVRDHDCLHI